MTNLAERASLSVSYLSEVENGRKSPSLQVVQRLAAALNLEPAALFASGPQGGRITPGERIRLLRTEQDLTLAQVANKVGIGASYLSEIERGRVSPAPATLNRIAEALDTGVAQILGPLAGLGARLRQAREDLATVRPNWQNGRLFHRVWWAKLSAAKCSHRFLPWITWLQPWAYHLVT